MYERQEEILQKLKQLKEVNDSNKGMILNEKVKVPVGIKVYNNFQNK